MGNFLRVDLRRNGDGAAYEYMTQREDNLLSATWV
jgi:hypothetical protein